MQPRMTRIPRGSRAKKLPTDPDRPGRPTFCASMLPRDSEAWRTRAAYRTGMASGDQSAPREGSHRIPHPRPGSPPPPPTPAPAPPICHRDTGTPVGGNPQAASVAVTRSRVTPHPRLPSRGASGPRRLRLSSQHSPRFAIAREYPVHHAAGRELLLPSLSSRDRELGGIVSGCGVSNSHRCSCATRIQGPPAPQVEVYGFADITLRCELQKHGLCTVIQGSKLWIFEHSPIDSNSVHRRTSVS